MTMPRRMREYAFREAQWQRRYEPHVEAINRYVVGYAKPGGNIDRLIQQLEQSKPVHYL